MRGVESLFGNHWMDIEFNCNQCGQHLVVDAVGIGQIVKCPKCGFSRTVPRTTDTSPSEKTTQLNENTRSCVLPWQQFVVIALVVVVWAFAALGLVITSVFTTAVTLAVVVLAIPTVVVLKRKRRIKPIIGICGLALVILLILIVNFSSSSSDDLAYNLGSDEGVANADSRRPELSGFQLDERARRVAIDKRVEDLKVLAWTNRFKKGYKRGYDWRSSPLGVGRNAGYTQCRSGYVKPNADALDAMARRAYDGVGWTDMFKEGYKTGWKAAGGAW